MSFYKRLKYQKCHELAPLTYVRQDEQLNNHLMVDQNEKQKYLSWYQNEIKVREISLKLIKFSNKLNFVLIFSIIIFHSKINFN